MSAEIRNDYKKLIVDTGNEMVERGITVGTWGNISVRDPRSALVYISPSGMDYESIETEDVVVLDMDGKIVDGKAEPSIEKPMHLAVYKARADVHAVIHTHPVYSTAFGVAGVPLPGVSEDFVQIVGAEVQIALPYQLPGSEALAQVAAEHLGSNNAVLLPGHGALVVGEDMRTALKVSLVLEKNAQIYLNAKLLGNTIRTFSDDEVQAMQNFVRDHYGKRNRNLHDAKPSKKKGA